MLEFENNYLVDEDDNSEGYKSERYQIYSFTQDRVST